jgi:hypothetical protein
MLTLFTILKSFETPQIAQIQRNALRAWQHMQPAPEIFVFGDKPGTAEVCAELGLRHFPKIKRGETGMELMSDAYAQTWKKASNDLCCYINGDIILPPMFPGMALALDAEQFLAVGQRRNTPVDFELEFTEGWWGKLKDHAFRSGALHSVSGIDWFLHRRSGLAPLPDLYCGTWWGDNVILGLARKRGIPIIDCSSVITTIHQNHDYRHYNGGLDGIANGAESAHNRAQLPDGISLTIAEADYRLLERTV